MNEDFENQLRRALRPVEPPEGFAERLMRALPERRMPAKVVTLQVARPAPRSNLWRRISTPAALAASLVVAVLAGRQVGIEREKDEQRAGLEASRELMQALRVASQKLDLAYEAVQRPAPPANDVEENRS